jgi:zinc transport system permease protein
VAVLHETPVLTWRAFLGAWDLFRDPLLCALVAGAVLGFLGVFVVLRRMVFVSAGVTQSAGLGVALAFYAEIHLGVHLDPLVGAATLSLLATLALSSTPGILRLPRESVLGLVFALSGGGAVLLGDRISQEAHDIESILFGSAVLVRPLDLAIVLVAGGIILAVHLWWIRGLVFASFDPDAARVQGLPVSLLDRTLFVSIGIMVGVSARALGSLPVFAFSVLPAAAALLVGSAPVGARGRHPARRARRRGRLPLRLLLSIPRRRQSDGGGERFVVVAILVRLVGRRPLRLARPVGAETLAPRT